jgi:hypothetical protein
MLPLSAAHQQNLHVLYDYNIGDNVVSFQPEHCANL